MSTEPRWWQVTTHIGSCIITGEYEVGAKLGKLQELADEHGCGVSTIQRALSTLEYLGMIESRQGSGYYVTARYPRDVREDWNAENC